ncbi:hypothetical protein [Limnoglobus roseus]|uniref:hypothetical protein n=1 Tax=Limnoglobus roseus TaxID=2598579 RepID=UPI00143D250D|nr:hypothetical protein [Limnoglobus roseus]
MVRGIENNAAAEFTGRSIYGTHLVKIALAIDGLLHDIGGPPQYRMGGIERCQPDAPDGKQCGLPIA